MSRFNTLTPDQVSKLSDSDLCEAVHELVMGLPVQSQDIPIRTVGDFRPDEWLPHIPGPTYNVLRYLEHLGACEPVMQRLERLDFHIVFNFYRDVFRKESQFNATVYPISQPPHCDSDVSSFSHSSRPRAFLEAALLGRLMWPEKFTTHK